VFLVAGSRNRRVAQILFEQPGESGNLKQGRKKREESAAFIESSFGTYRKSDIGGTVKKTGGALSGGSETLIVVHGRQDPVSSMTAYALDRQGAGNTNVILASSGKVRRLTPLECERLQGFPDNYTRITWRNKPAEQCPDAPRYMAIGNSMAVPVMRWIGERVCKI
jgi:COG0270: site-specific DNA methylase